MISQQSVYCFNSLSYLHTKIENIIKFHLSVCCLVQVIMQLSKNRYIGMRFMKCVYTNLYMYKEQVNKRKTYSLIQNCYIYKIKTLLKICPWARWAFLEKSNKLWYFYGFVVCIIGLQLYVINVCMLRCYGNFRCLYIIAIFSIWYYSLEMKLQLHLDAKFLHIC